MSTACLLTLAVPTHVYKQHNAACPLLVFSHQLLQKTFTNSIPQHVHCLCFHTSCSNTRLQTVYRSMSTACVLTPAVTTEVNKQRTTACPLLVFSFQLLQQTFTYSTPQHKFCCDSTKAVTTDVYKQHTATCPLLLFWHQLLQHTFPNSKPQHVHCLCSQTSCSNTSLQTAYSNMSTDCVLTPAVTADV